MNKLIYKLIKATEKLNKNLYKYKNRKLMMDFERRKKRVHVDTKDFTPFYEPRGTTKQVQMKSGMVGTFELVNFLPFLEFGEAYDEPQETHWMFLGYTETILLDDMTFEDYKSETEVYKDLGDTRV